MEPLGLFRGAKPVLVMKAWVVSLLVLRPHWGATTRRRPQVPTAFRSRAASMDAWSWWLLDVLRK